MSAAFWFRRRPAPPVQRWLHGHHGLLQQLGRGATSEVYLARDPQGQEYAVKIPQHPDHCLEREAALHQRVNSPFVVSCLGLCRRGPTPTLRLQALQGETLAERLARRGRLARPLLLALSRQLFQALQAVHQAGLVHGDVKPANLFLCPRGRRVDLKLIDFGLAGEPGERRPCGPQGTAPYAAPEQFLDSPMQTASDLYAVGVVLFEMATGLLPWNSSDPAVLTTLKRQPPPCPSRYGTDLGPGRELLIRSLLQPSPEARPSSLAEVLARW